MKIKGHRGSSSILLPIISTPSQRRFCLVLVQHPGPVSQSVSFPRVSAPLPLPKYMYICPHVHPYIPYIHTVYMRSQIHAHIPHVASHSKSDSNPNAMSTPPVTPKVQGASRKPPVCFLVPLGPLRRPPPSLPLEPVRSLPPPHPDDWTGLDGARRLNDGDSGDEEE